jgi:short-subunit dehydrogenase
MTSLRARILYPSVTLNKRKASTRLNGKTILITGATFGIGESLVRHLFHYEVTLILVARTAEKLLALKNESLAHAAKVITFSCDFYSEESISVLCDKLKSIHIDYFISNAGKSLMRSFEESINRTHDYRRTMAVNYLAPVQLVTTLSESFKIANTHIVNVSTYNVLLKTPPKWSAYVSSKKAMQSWIESNTLELTAMNITVSNIYLPLVESRMKDANKSYVYTPAMSMDTAVIVIVKGLLKRNYHFKPWWHAPFQVVMLLGDPLWNFYWSRRIRKGK